MCGQHVITLAPVGCRYNSWMSTGSSTYTLYQQTFTSYKVNVYASLPYVTGEQQTPAGCSIPFLDIDCCSSPSKWLVEHGAHVAAQLASSNVLVGALERGAAPVACNA